MYRVTSLTRAMYSEDSSEFNTLAEQDTEIVTGKVDYNLAIDETSNFESGFKYSNINTDSEIIRIDIINGSEVINTDNTDAFKYDEKVFAAYTNFSKSWEKWDLNIGIRVEQTNIEGESLTLSATNTQDYLNWVSKREFVPSSIGKCKSIWKL